MTCQALMPNETNRVYIHGRADSFHFALADLAPLSGLTLVSALRFTCCYSYSVSSQITEYY